MTARATNGLRAQVRKEILQLVVLAQISQDIFAFKGFQPLCHSQQLRALLRRAAACCIGGNQAIEGAPQLEKQQLLDHVDLCDLSPVARQYPDEVISLQSLQRFAHWASCRCPAWH